METAPETLNELIILLRTALLNPNQRNSAVKNFQNCMFNHKEPITGASESQWSILNELAYDIDFYEPNAEIRSEDPSLYGDVQFAREIETTLRKLDKN